MEGKWVLDLLAAAATLGAYGYASTTAVKESLFHN